MSKPKKVSWADMADEEDAELALPVVISKHGIRVKKERSVPRVPETPVKKTKPSSSKKDGV